MRLTCSSTTAVVFGQLSRCYFTIETEWWLRTTLASGCGMLAGSAPTLSCPRPPCQCPVLHWPLASGLWLPLHLPGPPFQIITETRPSRVSSLSTVKTLHRAVAAFNASFTPLQIDASTDRLIVYTQILARVCYAPLPKRLTRYSRDLTSVKPLPLSAGQAWLLLSIHTGLWLQRK